MMVQPHVKSNTCSDLYEKLIKIVGNKTGDELIAERANARPAGMEHLSNSDYKAY